VGTESYPMKKTPQTTDTYYQRQGMHNVLLFVPERLKSEIQREAADQQVSMRDLYLKAMANFIGKTNAAMSAGKLSEFTFRATLRRAQGERFQMWLDPAMAEQVEMLAEAAAVTQRAFCYSALLDTFNTSGETTS
jgi:hypothetical protein